MKILLHFAHRCVTDDNDGTDNNDGDGRHGYWRPNDLGVKKELARELVLVVLSWVLLVLMLSMVAVLLLPLLSFMSSMTGDSALLAVFGLCCCCCCCLHRLILSFISLFISCPVLPCSSTGPKD